MSSALRLALIVLAAAILAFGARAMYVSSQQVQAPSDPEVRIRITASNLPAGLLLRDSDLEWQSVPKSKVPKKSITEDVGLDIASGALLRNALNAGVVIKTSDVVSSDSPGFLAAVLKPGMRAVSVLVNDVSGNAGLMQPGDYVDMILTQQIINRDDVSTLDRQIVSETVVERARIIAVGSSFQRESDGSKATRARTVTVEVQPRAAEAVTVAAELGTLSLALRSFATTDRGPDAAMAEETGALVVAWRGNNLSDSTGPVWGSDVSRVLSRQAQQNHATSDQENTGPAPSSKPQVANVKNIVVFRGEKTSVINSANSAVIDYSNNSPEQP